MKNRKNILIAMALSLLANINLVAQETENQVPINFYLGASYTLTPNFDIDGIWTVNANTSARFYSLFADLVINQNLIGRAQVGTLSVASLSEDISDELESGFQMSGSLGYNYILPNNNKISLPIMATLGYATVKDSSARDVGMQIGGTIGLNYGISDRLNASSSLRYLKGVKFNDGAKLSQVDFSIGIQFRLL